MLHRMVLVLANNEYRLLALPDGGRLLTFGRKCYRWDTRTDGSMQLTRVAPGTKTQGLLRRGNYWLFDVIHNERFTPGIHLSIVIEPGKWEAFVISPQLPTKIGDTCTITATDERIAWHPNRLAASNS